jgi:predicted CXXCH cytochrome family protein
VLIATTAGVLLSDAGASAQDRVDQATSAFRDDVHARAGLTCGSCHSARTQAAPSEFAAPRRTDIAPLCAKCHSDAAYMRPFAPQVRVDQMAQYVTSAHGKRMTAGDDRAATCSDCHGAHGVARVSDSRSPVAPLNAARTCGRCHSDAARMSAFGQSTTAFAEWSSSVHATALLTRGDTSAPTCNTCHGSHGATPPGITEVAGVCAQCHVREAELFRASPKKPLFDAIGQPECLTCHSNHRIERPADAWVGLGKESVCATCHDESTPGSKTILEVRDGLDDLTRRIATADDTLKRAERSGMLVIDGSSALREAHESLIHSRVLVHAFAAKPFAEALAPGLVAAERGEQVGVEALRELERRRRGLALATVFIVGFLLSLWLKIRRLPDTLSHD